MRKAKALVVGLVLALGLAMAGTALADPDFGTGNSSKGPQDAGSVCSPSPSLDANLAQCK